MPEFKTWVIIGLIAFSWMLYSYPDKVSFISDATFGKANEFLKVNNPLTKEKAVETVCPETINSVCGSDGVTYDNMCKAAVAGILDVTVGECESG